MKQVFQIERVDLETLRRGDQIVLSMNGAMLALELEPPLVRRTAPPVPEATQPPRRRTERKGLFHCPLCSLTLTHPSSIYKHAEKIHGQRVSLATKRRAPRSALHCQHPNCSYVAETSAGLVQHTYRRHSRKGRKVVKQWIKAMQKGGHLSGRRKEA